jgi:hypothetical protein
MTELIDSILSQTSWVAVEEELQKRKDVLLRQMVYDNLCYEDYLRLSGEIKGLDFVIKLKSRRLSSV